MVENTQQNAQALRQLKIKTGSVKRMLKDHMSYKKEQTKLEEKIEKMKADETEEGVIKRYEQELADTVALIPSI